LDIDESQEYLLKAPNGEYSVEIFADGESPITGNVVLSGRSVDVKEVGSRVIRHPLSWLFLILILGVVLFVFMKKGRKRFFSGMKKKPRTESVESMKQITPKKETLVHAKNRAELSLSIKGEKQPSSIVCLTLKNLGDLKDRDATTAILQKAVNFAEDNKALIYETEGNLFFILAPVKTKTFKNERSALTIAQRVESLLTSQNKLFKEKLDFGISIGNGEIVAKQDKDSFKFMALGPTIINSKKIAARSSGEILLGGEVVSKLGSDLKANKVDEGIYEIKELKYKTEETQKFLDNFVKNYKKSRN
jgi:hypothetical protein